MRQREEQNSPKFANCTVYDIENGKKYPLLLMNINIMCLQKSIQKTVGSCKGAIKQGWDLFVLIYSWLERVICCRMWPDWKGQSSHFHMPFQLAAYEEAKLFHNSLINEISSCPEVQKSHRAESCISGPVRVQILTGITKYNYLVSHSQISP